MLTIAASAAALAACEPPGPNMAALCRDLAQDEPQLQRLLTIAGTEADATCDCYGKMVAALPEDRRVAVSQGLADMVTEKDARGIDMQGVYRLYLDGDISLEGKPYDTDDLDDAAELLEEAAEGLGRDGACPA